MASFADILSQPPIAALVLSYQCGIYGDVYPRFAASRRAVEYRCGDAGRGMYVLRAGFVTSLAADDSVDTDDEHLSVLYASTLGLTLAGDSDARFPLLVSIAEGDGHVVDRLLACCPHLASAEAIETAFLHHRVAIAKDLLVRRDASLPALSVRQSPLDAGHWTQRIGHELPRTVLYHDNAEAFACFLQYWYARLSEAIVRDWLRMAVHGGCTNVARYLLTLVEDPNVLVDDVVTLGALDIVQQLVESGKPYTSCALDRAAAHGHLHVLAFLHDQDAVACTPAAMDDAASNGHLDVVVFLHTHRTEGCSRDAMDRAAANGHLEVVQFLHEHRSEGCTLHALDAAINKGHLDVIRFLWTHRSEGCSANALDVAIRHGHEHVVAFLHGTGTFGAIATAAIEHASAAGHTAVLDYLVARGAIPRQCYALAIQSALVHGHASIAHRLVSHPVIQLGDLNLEAALVGPTCMEVAVFLRQHMVVLTPDDLASACGSRRVDLVRYLHATDPTTVFPSHGLERAASNGSLAIVRYLVDVCGVRCSLEAFRLAVLGSHCQTIAYLLSTDKSIRNDTTWLLFAGCNHLYSVMDLFVANGMGDPSEALVHACNWMWHAEAFRRLLLHCLSPTNAVYNVHMLVEAYKVLYTRNTSAVLALVAQTIYDQVEKLRPKPETEKCFVGAVRELVSRLRDDDVANWAIATLFVWATEDAAANADRLAAWANSVHEPRVRACLVALYEEVLPHAYVEWTPLLPETWKSFDEPDMM